MRQMRARYNQSHEITMTAQHCKSSIVGFGGWGGRQDVGHIHNMLLSDEADGSLDLKDESHVRARNKERSPRPEQWQLSSHVGCGAQLGTRAGDDDATTRYPRRQR